MIWTSDHAAERFIARGGYGMDVPEVKKLISNSISHWEPMIRYFKEGTVSIPNTKLKAVVVEAENGDLVVATVKHKNSETFSGGKNATLQKAKHRHIRAMEKE